MNAAVLIFALLSLAFADNIYFQGPDTDWNNASNWDMGFVPTNATYDVFIDADCHLPASVDVNSITVRSVTLFASIDTTVNAPIDLPNSDSVLDVTAKVTGTGSITRGRIAAHTGAWISIPVTDSNIDFTGGYIESLTLAYSRTITGGDMDTPVIGSLDLQSTLGSSSEMHNLTVGSLAWDGSSLYYNLKVTGSVLLTGSTHYVYGMFHAVNDTLDHWWVSGSVYLEDGADVWMSGHWHCNDTLTNDNACYFDSHYNTPAVLTLDGVFDASKSYYQRTNVYGGKLTTTAQFLGGLYMNTYVTGTFNEGTSFGNHLVSFSGVKLDINTGIAFDNFKIGSSSSVVNIMADMVSFVNFTSAGEVHSDYNVTILNLETDGQTDLYGDVQYTINDTYTQDSYLYVHNSSLFINSNCAAKISSSLYLVGSGKFYNYGDLTWSATYLYVDTDAAFLNVGVFHFTGSGDLYARPVTSGVEGGQFVNLGVMSTTGRNYFKFDDAIPFYQCKSGVLDLSFQGSTPFLYFTDKAVVNGKINAVFDTQAAFDGVSSSGIGFGSWATRAGTVITKLPLNGQASTYTVINGDSSYTKGVSCQDISSSSTTITYYHTFDIPLLKCRSFDPTDIPDNDWCNLVDQPFFNGSAKTSFTLAALAVVAAFMLFF